MFVKIQLIMEEWVPLKNYEESHQISSLGRVKSLSRLVESRKNGKKRRIKECILRQSTNNKGYNIVTICLFGVKKSYLIHKLMAESFLNHKPCGHAIVIDHINNVPNDNRLENLQLISHRENCSKDRKGSSKYTGVTWHKRDKKWQAQIRLNGKLKYLGGFDCELKAHFAYVKELQIINNK